MERPSRHRKTVNYVDFLDDDDEDFAAVKAPPHKKARGSVKEPQHEKESKTPINSAHERGLSEITGKGCKERVSLDEKLYKRDLEAALSLSLLRSTETMEMPLTRGRDDEKPLEDSPPVLMHFSTDSSCLEQDTSSRPLLQDLPPVLSNCSVDVSELGLDQIISEHPFLPAIPGQRKPSQAPQGQRPALQEEKDEDYQPQNTPESDADFSDPDESEDEEYTGKRKGEKKKTKKNERKTAPKAVKEKRPVKTPKAKSHSTALNRSPAVSHPASNRSPTTPPVAKPALCSSPAEGRIPKWNPPGVVGRSPGSCLNGPVKSPGSGLRLGLSRLARVKPLHPNTASR
ncbi:RAD51-associated protein 1 [Brachyhypopomus gauderio]|uniref:RAD51-associated protein 1 n=1 Tax=Brachyhypopomus gauderio TaxID=698409 RepID=UPI004041CAA8